MRLTVCAVVITALTAGAACSRAERATYDVEEKSIRDLQSDLVSGRTTSEALVTAYLERIARIDHAGPTLRSVLRTNPDALAQARALDAERAGGRIRGPLHGIPILVKDNIETTGSDAHHGRIPGARGERHPS